MTEFIVQEEEVDFETSEIIEMDNNWMQNPESNNEYHSLTSFPGMRIFLKNNFPGVIEMCANQGKTLDNSTRDDIARDIIRSLLNSQHNMS